MPILSLPAELLCRIFQDGANTNHPSSSSSSSSSPSPFLLKPDQDYYAPLNTSFQIYLSHVCRQWRYIALRNSSLWTTLHFQEPPHLTRASAFLTRSAGSPYPLDILLDTVAYSDHVPGVTLCRDEIERVFDIIVPHVHRWRSFALKIRDNHCKISARKYLSQLGTAPLLETLQLYHFENFRTSGDLYIATHRPPVAIFHNSLPKLRNLSLIGVNLPWASSPFLSALYHLELALHSENVRPSYAQWESILRSCPALRSLSLHYSGPRLPDSTNPWPLLNPRNPDHSNNEEESEVPGNITLPHLAYLTLTDLDPDYLCALFTYLDFPAVHTLSLELPEQDFTLFVEMLAGGDFSKDGYAHDNATNTLRDVQYTNNIPTNIPLPGSTSSSSPSDTTTTDPTPLPPTSPPYPHTPTPLFPALHTLRISALECSAASWVRLLQAVPNLGVLDADFGRTGGLYDALVSTQRKEVPRPRPRPRPTSTPTETNVLESNDNPHNPPSPAPHNPPPLPLLPNLHTLYATHLPGTRLAALIEHRAECGRQVGRWCVRVPRGRGGEARGLYGLYGGDQVLEGLVERGWAGGVGEGPEGGDGGPEGGDGECGRVGVRVEVERGVGDEGSDVEEGDGEDVEDDESEGSEEEEEEKI